MNKKKEIAMFFCVSGGWYNRLVEIESSLRSLGSVSGSQLFQVAAPGSRDCSGRRQHANICFFKEVSVSVYSAILHRQMYM
jgi:hypothetical protein